MDDNQAAFDPDVEKRSKQDKYEVERSNDAEFYIYVFFEMITAIQLGSFAYFISKSYGLPAGETEGASEWPAAIESVLEVISWLRLNFAEEGFIAAYLFGSCLMVLFMLILILTQLEPFEYLQEIFVEGENKWLKINGFLFGILYLPILANALQTFNCEGDVMVKAPSVDCWEGIHIGMVVLSILCGGFMFFGGGINAFVRNRQMHYSGETQRQRKSVQYFNAKHLLYRMIMTVLAVFPPTNTAAGSLAISMTLSLLMATWSIWRLPHLETRYNVALACKYAFSSWSFICSFIASARDEGNDVASSVLLLAGYPLFCIGVTYIGYRWDKANPPKQSDFDNAGFDGLRRYQSTHTEQLADEFNLGYDQCLGYLNDDLDDLQHFMDNYLSNRTDLLALAVARGNDVPGRERDAPSGVQGALAAWPDEDRWERVCELAKRNEGLRVLRLENLRRTDVRHWDAFLQTLRAGGEEGEGEGQGEGEREGPGESGRTGGGDETGGGGDTHSVRIVSSDVAPRPYSKLKRLDLRMNSIKDPAAVEIVTVLLDCVRSGKLPQLSRVNLGDNQITARTRDQIEQMLNAAHEAGECRSLRKIAL